MKFNNKKVTWKGIKIIFKNAITGFSDDKVTNLSGSLAYYTIFSMSPLLMVILGLLSYFMGNGAEGKIFAALNQYVGESTANFLQEMIKNASLSGKSTIATTIGIGTVIFGATTVFAQIQESINTIWGIKPKPKKGWLKMLINRLLSFSLIISLGFIFLVSFILNTAIDVFSDRLQMMYPDITVVIFQISNLLITFGVICTVFATIFKFLPDAKIKWRDVWLGAMATTILFMAGHYLIGIYIDRSNFSSTYGLAASVIVLLVWIYYSSLILYFGAELTKSWATEYGDNIYPSEHAVSTKIIEVESKNRPLEAVNKMNILETDIIQEEVNLHEIIDENFSETVDNTDEK